MAHVEALSPVSAGTVESWHEKDIESLLSEKLLEGYSLLDTSCPHCVTPLVKKKAPTMNFSPKSDQPVSKDKGYAPHISMAYVAVKPQPSSDSMVLSGSFAETVPFSPVSGVPFCVACNAHVVTHDEDMIALERCHSLKDKGRIIVAFDEDRQDSTLEVRLPERPSSTLEMPASYAREEPEPEQENPAFEAIEAQHFFSERDASPFIEMNTSLKKPLSPKNMQSDPSPAQDAQREDHPAFDDATEEQRDMVPEDEPLGEMDTEEQLASIASKKPLGPHGSPSLMADAFMCGEATQTVSDDEPVLSLQEDSLPNKEIDEEKEGIIEPADEEEGIEQGIDEPADEEGIEQDLGEHTRKMESLGETAARFAMLPPKPVESDLLHPTEMEELDYKRAKSVPMEPTEKDEAHDLFTDEIMQEYSVRRDIATKVLGSKMLHGYSLVETQCLKCGMPLMEYQGQIDCVVCPVLVKKAKKKMKEQEEEKFLAEQKAKIEAEVVAQEKANEEAAARVKAEQEAAVAKTKADEEAAAKATAKAEEAATKAAATEEAKRMEAEEASMRAAAEEEAVAKGAAEEEAATFAADELELMFVFTNEDAFRMEEEARLAEEERLLEQARLAEEARVTEAVRIAEEEERMALEFLRAAEEEEQLALQNVEADTDMDRDLLEIEIVTSTDRDLPGGEEQLAKEGLLLALEALHTAEKEGQLALEDGEEDSLPETITSMLTMEREALRAAEEDERLALQILRDAEEEEQLALEALRAAEKEERLALEAISAAEAEEKARLALETLLAAEEVERLAQEAVRAEEEKILAEKAVEDTRIAEEQKKLRETEAMRAEQARIAYHARLEEEARRAAEIELAEKARIEAEEEMRRQELVKQAEEEARLIEALEKEANEKSKTAEAAWLEAKAALDQVSSARRQILQKTIAQAEVEAVAEAEEIVSSLAEGFKEAPKLPPTRSFIEREQWETLRMEGRSGMTRRMLQGWTMLPELCLGKECANTPLLLSKDGRKVQCVVCDGCGNGLDGVYEHIGYDSDEDVEEAADDLEEATDDLEEEASNTGNLVDKGLPKGGASIMSEKESCEERPVPSTPTATRSVSEFKDDFEAKRTYVSKEIGRKMMQGWSLLDLSCNECMMPLMHNPEQDEETCVICGPTPRPLPLFQEPKSRERRDDPPLDPPSADEDDEELESNVLKEEKLVTDALEEEEAKPSEKHEDPPEDPPTAVKDKEEFESNVFEKEKLDTDALDEEEAKPSEKHEDPPEDPPTAEEEEEDLESNAFKEEKLDTDALEEEEPKPIDKEVESIATLQLPEEELIGDISHTNKANIIEEDYAYEVTKSLSRPAKAKPMYSKVDEEKCAVESMKQPSLVEEPVFVVGKVHKQRDTIEEQCAIEVEVVGLTFDFDEGPVPSPTLPTEEVLTAGEVDKQSAVEEGECGFESIPTASSFAAPSFDEAPSPVKKPMVKEPMSDLDKEDRPVELVHEKSSADEAPAPAKKPVVKKSSAKDRPNELVYTKSPARPPRPMSKASIPPSPKRMLSPKSTASARVKRGPPKPEGLSKSPSPRSVPHSITARPVPMSFDHTNDEDGSNGSRMELIASSALDALLTRIDECKRNLNESSDPTFIMTQLTMIEKLSSAAISMRKLEEMS